MVTQNSLVSVFDKFTLRHGHCYTLSTMFYRICGHDSDPFNSWQWYVQYAPYPEDIQWYVLNAAISSLFHCSLTSGKTSV